jgi:hypothetical protein
MDGGPKIALFEPIGEFAIFLIFAPLFIKEKWKRLSSQKLLGLI